MKYESNTIKACLAAICRGNLSIDTVVLSKFYKVTDSRLQRVYSPQCLLIIYNCLLYVCVLLNNAARDYHNIEETLYEFIIKC